MQNTLTLDETRAVQTITLGSGLYRNPVFYGNLLAEPDTAKFIAWMKTQPGSQLLFTGLGPDVIEAGVELGRALVWSDVTKGELEMKALFTAMILLGEDPTDPDSFSDRYQQQVEAGPDHPIDFQETYYVLLKEGAYEIVSFTVRRRMNPLAFGSLEVSCSKPKLSKSEAALS